MRHINPDKVHRCLWLYDGTKWKKGVWILLNSTVTSFQNSDHALRKRHYDILNKFTFSCGQSKLLKHVIQQSYSWSLISIVLKVLLLSCVGTHILVSCLQQSGSCVPSLKFVHVWPNVMPRCIVCVSLILNSKEIRNNSTDPIFQSLYLSFIKRDIIIIFHYLFQKPTPFEVRLPTHRNKSFGIWIVETLLNLYE